MLEKNNKHFTGQETRNFQSSLTTKQQPLLRDASNATIFVSHVSKHAVGKLPPSKVALTCIAIRQIRAVDTERHQTALPAQTPSQSDPRHAEEDAELHHTVSKSLSKPQGCHCFDETCLNQDVR